VFDVYWLEKLLCQLYNDLTNLENLIMKVVRDALTENYKKLQQELFQNVVFAHHLGLNIREDKFQKVEHVK